MTELVIILPTPPSYHQCQGKSRKGGYKTAKYKNWIKNASLAFYLEKKQNISFKNPVEISLFVNGGNSLSDIDNYVKQFPDLLVTLGILKGDNKKYVQSINERWDVTGALERGTTLLCVSEL
ncbi:MAG: hypothetical protein COA78_22120 [Blastopirellula sp.]|nr:MAG: hypothetical protein COA78_22120 [Blastopirellula sp.]